MWNFYNTNTRNLRYAISIDRLDDSEGYIKSNMEFVTHGFNSWKRNLSRPVKVIETSSNATYYFMSCMEADRFFNVRIKSFGEILAGKKYHISGYCVVRSDISSVLNYSRCDGIHEYYIKFIEPQRRIK
jgi:hypothetical protein